MSWEVFGGRSARCYFGLLGTVAALVACHNSGSSNQSVRDASDDSAPGAGTGGAASDASGTGGSGARNGTGATGGVPTGGVIAFMHPDGYAAWVTAQASGKLTNVSSALNSVSPGEDKSLAISLDGKALALTTTRFGCGDWDCLVLVDRGLKSGERVQAGGEDVHPDRALAVGPGGGWVVYSADGGSHSRDLFVTRKSGGSWSTKQLLTASSGYAYNTQPSPTPDGKRVVFDCGNEPYGGAGNAVCSVGVDGSGFKVEAAPGSGFAAEATALHHPAMAPNGGLVFEMNRPDTGERIWSLSGGQAAQLGDFPNDNSPCVLPSGAVASLVLSRAGNSSGAHEIKLMSATGAESVMVLTDVDVIDVQLSCGG
ncbi:MAG: PD40 domain-containing protein [Polyangiaceae bacterium]|nr:PD40 domain-containing protein [Myxococcales bacterium]MCB9589687.1 PD40 domain-containing protein [Polyangiaceae bacterium]